MAMKALGLTYLMSKQAWGEGTVRRKEGVRELTAKPSKRKQDWIASALPFLV